MKILQVHTALVLLCCAFLISCTDTPAPVAEQKTPAAASDTSSNEIRETYYENGALRSRGTLVNGAREGLWTSYYPNGFLWSEGEYSNGLKNGRVVTYFEDGKIRYSGTFLNDVRAGLWSFYDSTGTVVKQIDYSKQSE